MHLRIGRDGNLEIRHALQPFHEVGGESVAARVGPIAAGILRRVAAERHHVADAGVPVAARDGIDFRAGRRDAGQVRGGAEPGVALDTGHRGVGPVARGAPGPVRDRDEKRGPSGASRSTVDQSAASISSVLGGKNSKDTCGALRTGLQDSSNTRSRPPTLRSGTIEQYPAAVRFRRPPTLYLVESLSGLCFRPWKRPGAGPLPAGERGSLAASCLPSPLPLAGGAGGGRLEGVKTAARPEVKPDSHGTSPAVTAVRNRGRICGANRRLRKTGTHSDICATCPRKHPRSRRAHWKSSMRRITFGAIRGERCPAPVDPVDRRPKGRQIVARNRTLGWRCSQVPEGACG